MLLDIDKQIKMDIPFLKERRVLYVGSDVDSRTYPHKWLAREFARAGWKFLFLPDMVSSITPELQHYLFPGNDESLSVKDMYQRIQDFACLNGSTGFLYRLNGDLFFRVIPEKPVFAYEKIVGDFLRALRTLKDERELFEEAVEVEGVPDVLFSKSLPEMPDEALDPRVQAILKEWDRIEQTYGITIEDLEEFLGYRVKLSCLDITTSGRIILPDFDRREVKMDDLTKALYFFFLRHPEGVRLKELCEYETEVLHIYSGLTGREDPAAIRQSVRNFLNPFGNALNISISRIKKAFRDVVGDRIARFYYVTGGYAEPRRILLDRDLVLWRH